MTRIVSVTPTSVESDSRTFRHATSFSRLGYESIVVEDIPSARLAERDLAFDLSAVRILPVVPVSGDLPNEEVQAKIDDLSVFRRLVSWFGRRYRALPATFRRAPSAVAHLVLSIVWFFQRYGQENLGAIPEADLYYLHGYHQYPAVGLLCRRYGAGYIYDAHDCYFVLADRTNLSWARRAELRFHDAVEHRTARNAAAVVTVSDGVAELMRQRFRRDVTVIPNAHDARLDEPPPDGMDIRASLQLAPDDFLLVVSGQLKPGMALDAAVTALEALNPQVHLALLGRGYKARPDLLEASSRSGRLHLLDPVEPTQVVPFIRTADLAPILYWPLTLNHRHALPNGFFQVVAAGLPILYGPLPEIARLAKKHGLGWEIDPLEPSSLVAQVERLLEDRDALEQARARVRAAAPVLAYENDEKRLQQLVAGVIAERGA